MNFAAKSRPVLFSRHRFTTANCPLDRRQRDRERGRQRDTEREGDRGTEREGGRGTQRGRQRDRERETEGQREGGRGTFLIGALTYSPVLKGGISNDERDK
jgi:hypothetical protein